LGEARFRVENHIWALLNINYSTERRLKAFENRVLRKIFGPKRDEVTGGSRKFHDEKLLNLYSSPNIIRIIKSRRIIWVEHVARMEAKHNSYRVLVGEP
jgi:hypothetical protein